MFDWLKNLDIPAAGFRILILLCDLLIAILLHRSTDLVQTLVTTPQYVFAQSEFD
ncbi:MAG: hypothetical protein WA702_22465 [Bradyrhizobium sp.]|uniref:hypothetical protein n=1 Tax=Bradyrhizobium sp. TaxID=376 RepID=UPI003C7DF20C